MASPCLKLSEGILFHDGKCFPRRGISRGASVSSYSCNQGQKFYWDTNALLKCSLICSPRRVSVACNANNYRRNPDFSRQQKGSSRGKSKQYQEPEHSDSTDETEFISSKNGSLLSLTSNTRYQATAAPGQREKEIVELFRKVQAQLRERAAIKEEKKIEAAQQGQSERGTVDSLLKLLRKHSVDQGKKNAGEEDLSIDQIDRSNPFDEEQNLNFFGPSNVKSEEVHERGHTRPVSNFRRKSPVPKVKFQPVFQAEDTGSTYSVKSQGKRKKTDDSVSSPVSGEEPQLLEVIDELSFDDKLDHFDSEKNTVDADAKESSAAEERPDLGSLKLSELRDLAKSRGIKGYSKLKKGELVELLSG